MSSTLSLPPLLGQSPDVTREFIWENMPAGLGIFLLIIAIGAVLFLTRHIFFPLGVLGQLCLAVGGVLLVLARVRAERLAVR